MVQQRALLAWAGLVAVVLASGIAAAASAPQGASVDGRMEPFENPGSSIQRDINALYNLIFPIAIVVGVLVEALLLYAILRFRSKGQRVVDSGEHERGHHTLEIAWTIPPAVILLMVGVLSTSTLGSIEEGPPRDFTVKVIASQWVWNFELPDGSVSTNNFTVVAGKVVNLNVTATDVIHSFAVPSLGVKIDAVPGRTNHYWLQADSPGDYQVQCMEYCAGAHAYMRGVVKVVSASEAQAAGCNAAGWCAPAGAALGCAQQTDATPNDVRFVESGGNPWSIAPPSLQLQANTKYCFNVINPAGQAAPHNMGIDDAQGKPVSVMPGTVLPGKTGSLTSTLPAGSYTYYCAVPGHRQLGMQGPLTVA